MGPYIARLCVRQTQRRYLHFKNPSSNQPSNQSEPQSNSTNSSTAQPILINKPINKLATLAHQIMANSYSDSNSLSSTVPIRQSFIQSHSPSTKTPQLEFPCLIQNREREREMDAAFMQKPIGLAKLVSTLDDDGPEPAYGNIVSGYKSFKHQQPFGFILGGEIPEFTMAYETWGTLNECKDNVILLHTGLSASSHAKSHPQNTNAGWWERFIGPGHALDTNRFYIICTNVLGGCYGSTGPISINPMTGKNYATTFPIITVADMVRAQFLLLDHLGIEKLYASVGASMGGMQSLAAAALYPHRVGRLVSISAAARSHPYSIALRHTQRQVLMSDPHWKEGHYYDSIPPHVGMKLSRQIGTISYRSGPEWEGRFGRKRAQPLLQPSLCADYLIETYLDHQGERFCMQYDANSMLYISKAMDMFDMSDRRHWESGALNDKPLHVPSPASSPQSEYAELDSLIEGVSSIHMPTLVLGVQSDILFPVWQQKEIADVIKASGNKRVTYYELDSMYGHDTFLIDTLAVGGALKGFLENRIDE